MTPAIRAQTASVASFRRPDEKSIERVPVIDVTDLYHPYEDPGDNFDLVHAYALPEVDLRGIVLDVTDAFRLPVANHPILWKDPNGPREPGMVPVLQLNSIFDSPVPSAVGPYNPMSSLNDPMFDAPRFQSAGIDLILRILHESNSKVDILSFGSCRTIAAAYNRNPGLMQNKVRRIHISAGTASRDFEFGSSEVHNKLPGGEWNVALDPHAFRRLLSSDLPIALYPCAAVNGAFEYDTHNTYWNLPDRHFVRELDPRIRNYILYALGRCIRADFLKSLDGNLDEGISQDRLSSVHHVWETAIWLEVTSRQVVRRRGKWQIIRGSDVNPSEPTLQCGLRPCNLTVREDARIKFNLTESSKTSIFTREDPLQYQEAMREAWPLLWKTFKSQKDA